MPEAPGNSKGEPGNSRDDVGNVPSAISYTRTASSNVPGTTR